MIQVSMKMDSSIYRLDMDRIFKKIMKEQLDIKRLSLVMAKWASSHFHQWMEKWPIVRKYPEVQGKQESNCWQCQKLKGLKQQTRKQHWDVINMKRRHWH